MAELLSALGLYGIRVATRRCRAGLRSSSELNVQLQSCSGVEPLLDVVDRRFGDLARPIKAAAVLSALERITYAEASAVDRVVLTTLRGDIEEVRLRPDMHVLDEMAAMRLIAAGSVDVSDELIEDFLQVSTTGTVTQRLAVDDELPTEELRALVVSRATRWQTVENEAVNSATQRLARTAKTSYLHLLAELSTRARESVNATATTASRGCAIGDRPDRRRCVLLRCPCYVALSISIRRRRRSPDGGCSGCRRPGTRVRRRANGRFSSRP